MSEPLRTNLHKICYPTNPSNYIFYGHADSK